MLRKLIVYTLLIMFVSSSFASAQSVTEMTILDKMIIVEKSLYGSEQTGSLIERVGRIEKDVYGAETRDALTVKLDRIYTYIEEDQPAEPSFLTKLNAAEWALAHNVTTQPAKARIENLERVLVGNSIPGSFDERLAKIMKLAYPNGQIAVESTTINKDTLVKIKLVSALDSRTSRPGDTVIYQAAEDVYVGGVLVIAKGTEGLGKVTKVEQSRNFGRDAELQISFDAIGAIDGSEIKTVMGDKAKEETKSLAKAAGATVAGLAILGPIGVVGGAFVHGKDVTVPAGSELYIQTKADVTVYGLQVK